jgi:hypothetical protein
MMITRSTAIEVRSSIRQLVDAGSKIKVVVGDDESQYFHLIR